MASPSPIARNWERVRERIAAAQRRAGRPNEPITVVAVSKTMPPEAVIEALDIGLRDFGENRVEAAETKIPCVHQLLERGSCAPRPRWHMVGHLQSRKVRGAAGLFSLIHSVDTVRLAQRLSRYCAQAGMVMPILLEMNVSGEPSKYGFPADRFTGDPVQRRDLLKSAELILALDGIEVGGLMTMAPFGQEQEVARPFFRKLRDLRDGLAERFPEGDWTHLSMGMTDDFEVAIEEGATLLRIGRAIFGPRRDG